MVEVLLLSVGAGILGTWIVLRSLSFFVHATGTAAFPGLVLADGLGVAAVAGALGTAGLVAVAVTALGRRRLTGQDSVVAIVLVGCLAAGVILASDVFRSGTNVESLLFGSLLLIDGADLVLAGACSAAVLAGTALLGERWLARGFDEEGARTLGLRSDAPALLLLGLVAVTAVASLQAIGGLLVAALFVVPAATTRLLFRRLAAWQLATVALVAAEGVGGLWLSVETNTPPGAAIAAVGGAVFAAVAIGRALGRRRAPALAVALAAAALLGAGCGGDGGGDGSGKVVASTTVVADVARAVAGSDADVVGLLRPNTDPHDYEPRPQDVADTAGARLVLVSGDGLDQWMDGVLRAAGGDAQVVDVGAAVPDRIDDPHWWHDPRNAVIAARRIGDALARAHPEHADGFRRNAAAYAAKVAGVDRAVERCIAAVPAAQRKLVTDHDAFGWFARRYGITVVGAVIPARTTAAQASAGDLASLSRTIRRERVRTVFPESSISAKVARALARQTGAAVGRELYGDTLGPAGSRGATYLGMLAANADAVVRGFTGGRSGCQSAYEAAAQ
jgi:ABC-type Zn uptake system ZnuABC Zn-binding protein ZnuA/ABC-type Mn2+/Zn2+ transport system permease subunit